MPSLSLSLIAYGLYLCGSKRTRINAMIMINYKIIELENVCKEQQKNI